MLIYNITFDDTINEIEVKNYDSRYYVTLDESVWYRKDRVFLSYDDAFKVALSRLQEKTNSAKRDYVFYVRKITELQREKVKRED